MSNKHHYNVLVTGANSGLGLGICIRLVDDFIKTKPESASLTVIFTTRSSQKGAETLRRLQVHVRINHSDDKERISFRSENVDLTNLLSVRALSSKLLASDLPHLDAIILNAGIGGWTGLDWWVLTKTILVDWIRATTWPTFKIGTVGSITQPQLPAVDGKQLDEPPLGEVFCANVFGHYMLSHWLTPLMWACPQSSRARMIWVSSVEGASKHYNSDDLQGLRSPAAYEHSKRLMDYLALTAQRQQATQKHVQMFLDPASALKPTQSRPKLTRPTIHVVQPGILTTTIISLYWIVQQFYLLGIYFARWLGSPWATVVPYAAAISATAIALLPHEDLEAEETKDGGTAVKWGSAIDRLGNSRVEMTEVPGWGLNGSGQPFADTWWGGPSWYGGGYMGRNKGMVDATKEDVEDFITTGANAWKQMEKLRIEWEQRLEEYNRLSEQS